MRWCDLKLLNILSSVSSVAQHHNLVDSTITKSSSSRSFWFNSDGIELMDVAIDVAVLRLFMLLNLLISEEFSANFGVETKTCKCACMELKRD